MQNLFYLSGDVAAPQKQDGPLIIAHVVSDLGIWPTRANRASRAIRKRWPESQSAYSDWYRNRIHNDFGFGAVQFVSPGRLHVCRIVRIANMVAERGTMISRDKGPRICYRTLARCLAQVSQKARRIGASVHLPRVGMDQHDANWPRIESLIIGLLSERDISVFVYDDEKEASVRERLNLQEPKQRERIVLSLDSYRPQETVSWTTKF